MNKRPVIKFCSIGLAVVLTAILAGLFLPARSITMEGIGVLSLESHIAVAASAGEVGSYPIRQYSPGPDEVTYYFDAHHATEKWTTTPEYMVDNVLTNYASTTVNNQVERLTGNTCPGTDLGAITKVEIRAYAYGDGNDELYIRPEFTGGTGDNHITVPTIEGAWGAYQDITSDTNAPDWSSWSHVVDLECDIELDDTAAGKTMYCAKVEIRVTYTVVPTVTTQAVDDIGSTTATGHGTISATGGENCDKRGVCWNTTGNPTVADSKSEETDSFGTGAFSRSMTGLSSGQLYYVRAYAHNSAGYGYGSQVEFTTFSAEILRPNAAGDLTQLGASAGSNYACVNEVDADDDTTYVYEDFGETVSEDLYNLPSHSVGSGTINKITVYARCCEIYCNPENYARVSIKSNSTISYGSFENLTDEWITYSQEWATNPADSQAWEWDDIDALQIGVELETSYEWNEEARCTQIYVEVYYTPAAEEADISNIPTSIDFLTVSENTSYWSKGSAPTFPLDDGECYFTVTNNGDTCSITIKATDFTGGVGWTLAASPGENIVTLKAGKSGDSLESDMVTLTTSNQAFISALAGSATKKWEIKLETPTSFTDGVEKTSTVTLTATLD